MSTTQAPVPPSDQYDPDDFFKDTRMSFVDHIEELRNHLWRAVYGFLVALVISLFLGSYVLDTITAPVKAQLSAYYDRQKNRILVEKKNEVSSLTRPTPFRKVYFYRPHLEAVLAGRAPENEHPIWKTQEEEQAEQAPPSALSWLISGSPKKAEESPLLGDETAPPVFIKPEEKDQKLVALWISFDNPLFVGADTFQVQREYLGTDTPTTLRAEEGFFVWFKVCIVTGFVLGSPWIFYEIWSFVAAGLYPHEKRLVHFYLPISLGLFITGVVICQVFVIPKALEALLWFNEWLGFRPDIRLNEWLDFAILLPVVFGISFQTPMVMLLLNRLNIITMETFASQRKIAWFGMALFSALITPADALSMIMLWVPMCFLFELGILMMWLSPNQPDEEDSDDGELVEV